MTHISIFKFTLWANLWIFLFSDIPIRDLIAAASYALNKRHYLIALEWLESVKKLSKVGVKSALLEIEKENHMLKINNEHEQGKLYHSVLRMHRKTFENKRKSIIDKKLKLLYDKVYGRSKKSLDVTSKPDKNKYFESYLAMLMNVTINFVSIIL